MVFCVCCCHSWCGTFDHVWDFTSL